MRVRVYDADPIRATQAMAQGFPAMTGHYFYVANDGYHELAESERRKIAQTWLTYFNKE